MTYDLVLRARRLVDHDGERPATVAVAGGRVALVASYDEPVEATEVVELGADQVLLPGLVDTHVHVNDPGRTAWEGFASATRAAAAGGVTTIVDMPLNSIPPTVDVPALELKRATALSQAFVDVGFWGGAVPGNLADLAPLWERGVFGFKSFLLPSGVEEFPPLDRLELAVVAAKLVRLGGLLIVHAEDSRVIEASPVAAGAHYADFLASRPRAAENVAVADVVAVARATGCRVHVLHVSSAETLALLARARADGLPVSAETCPHYLSFAAEEIPDGATPYKCCPPIREAANRDRLWEGLRDGVISMVVSDHSPSTPDLKRLESGDFAAAWGGISSLQLGLAAVWTEARARGFGLPDVVRWMARNPADLVGLRGKGRIEVGGDADLVVLDPDAELVVDPRALHHKNPITPYDGRRLCGVVRSTWLRGRKVDLEAEPRGRLLERQDR
ncbi:MAG: allantoinase AllB [Nocardioidaceae bacterium]|nr:allantoinase AllB [Nocardioidaceae bacterium]